MPRSRSKPNKLSIEDLHYLAGIWESSIGLKGLGTGSAVAISNTETWPKAMAETFGGEASEFTSTKGKVYWGWYVPLARRLELANELKAADVLRGTSDADWEKVWAKLSKGVSNSEYDDIR